MKRSLKKAVVLLGMAFIFLGLQRETGMFESTEDYRWKNRVILVKSNMNHLFRDQVKIADDNQMTFSERKLVVKRISSDHKFIKDYPGQHVFLVGLDGGIKKAKSSIFNGNDLVEIIDSMPMRKNEIYTKENL